MNKSSNQLRTIVLIAHDMRSSHNVGSLMRTCEGLAISHLYLSGYTPYPRLEGDRRLPFIVDKLDKQISKTALNAQNSLDWSYSPDLDSLISQLKAQAFNILALEQSAGSLPLNSYRPGNKLALVLGNEVTGLSQAQLTLCDQILEIPMYGQKESFNVVQAAAMAMYHLRFA